MDCRRGYLYSLNVQAAQTNPIGLLHSFLFFYDNLYAYTSIKDQGKETNYYFVCHYTTRIHHSTGDQNALNSEDIFRGMRSSI